VHRASKEKNLPNIPREGVGRLCPLLRMHFTRGACNAPAAGRVHSRCVHREIRESGRRFKVVEKICCAI